MKSMCSRIEKTLNEDFKYAVDIGSEDEVCNSWIKYFNHIRTLSATEKRYDKELYSQNIQIFHQWKETICSTNI